MTFSLGAKSIKNLKGVHPDLVRVVQRAIVLTTQDFTVQEGLRSLEVQRDYVARGVSKTMASKHLKQPDKFGHAVDLVPVVNGVPRWEWPIIYPVAAAMHLAAEELRVALRWGGVWDKNFQALVGSPTALKQAVADYCVRHPGPDFLDGPHYELIS